MDLTIIIPDYKSPYLGEIIENAVTLNANKIIISNYETPYTKKLENNFKEQKHIKFLNFHERKNPGDYRNEGVKNAFTKNLLFLDSDVRINSKTKNFINENK